MVIVTMAGGFTLWLIVRNLLPEKRGGLAVACFLACFTAALALDLWLNQDFVREFITRFPRFGPA